MMPLISNLLVFCTIMKVILIGAGRLATNLGKALLEAGHDILQVYSRTMESASALATLAGGAPVTEIERCARMLMCILSQ